MKNVKMTAPEPLNQLRRPMRLQSEIYLADGIHLYEFRTLDGAPVPAADPGCHVDLTLGPDLVRSYSVIDQGEREDTYRIAVKNEVEGRGGSRLMHSTLKPGQVIDVLGPRNHFALNEDPAPSVLIAGGIGITPIFSMARRLSAQGKEFVLHYACRSRQQAVFLDEIEKLKGEVNLYFDDAVAAPPAFDMVTTIAGAPADAHLYCCGPTPMLDAFVAATEARDEALVHMEYFSADIEVATEGGFEVVLAQSGTTVRIEPGHTILDTLTEMGMDLPSSCHEGVCGSCEVLVLEGLPDHRDMVLSAAEKRANKSMMICCSGATSTRLVLDL